MDLKYQVNETVFDAKSLLDEQNFYHQEQGKPDQLTRTLTYILGDYNKNYPISMMTSSELANKGAMKGLTDVQYTYPVMGRDSKASVVGTSKYQAGDKPGVGQSKFILNLTDNWIKKYYIIQSTNGIQAYTFDSGVPSPDGGFDYEVQLSAAEDDEYCPLSELQAGVLWVDLNTQVAESESRGTESKMAAPGSYKNQLGFIRTSMQWAGNVASKVMNIEVKTDKGKANLWMDYFMWQFEKRWLRECEHTYWYSRYNRKSNGSISLKDKLTGKVIPIGSGLLEQIQNKSTYSRLTYASLSNKISEALFGQSDTDNMSITLYTGLGGMREIHRAMKEEGINLLGSLGGGNVADKFVTGQGRSLMLGGFFDGFYHIDGYVIKVKHNPLFDLGQVALGSPKHPESEFPLESYRMVFIDDSDYDGQPNIQCVYEKGRKTIHGVVAGLSSAPKSLQILGGFNLQDSGAAQLLTSEEDKSSYHRFKSMGVQMLRGNKCFDLQCIAGR